MTNQEIKFLVYSLMILWLLSVIFFNVLIYLKEKWQSEMFFKQEVKIVYKTPPIIKLKHQFIIDESSPIPKDYLLEDISRVFAKELIKSNLIEMKEINKYEFNNQFSQFQNIKRYESRLNIVKLDENF